MSNPPGTQCVIVVAAAIGEGRSEWLDGFEVQLHGSHSRLVGWIEDQAALHGVLGRLRDLAIPIVGVRVGSGDADSDGEGLPSRREEGCT